MYACVKFELKKIAFSKLPDATAYNFAAFASTPFLK
jgi:hypothetical protein